MKVKINLDGRKIEITGVVRCENKAKGLMFSKKDNPPLLFEFPQEGNWSIHSFFVFYPFIAIWINKGKVVDYRVVKPFSTSIKPSSPFDKLLEIPINEKNQEIVNLVVGK